MTLAAIFGEQSLTKVGATFNDGASARDAAKRLPDKTGIGSNQIRVVEPGDADIDRKLEPETRGIRGTLWRAHATLGGAGLGLGLLVGLLLVTSGIRLFEWNPSYTFLVFGFFGAIAGLLLGGLVSLRPDHAQLAGWAKDAADDDRWIVLVHARDQDQARKARDALKVMSGRVAGTL
jgi:hypothetical protein